MAKINHITIKDVTRYLETIAYLPELPTATEDSADLVSVNNTLYVKQVTNGVYSYDTIQAGGGNVPSGDGVPIIEINVDYADFMEYISETYSDLSAIMDGVEYVYNLSDEEMDLFTTDFNIIRFKLNVLGESLSSYYSPMASMPDSECIYASAMPEGLLSALLFSEMGWSMREGILISFEKKTLTWTASPRFSTIADLSNLATDTNTIEISSMWADHLMSGQAVKIDNLYFRVPYINADGSYMLSAYDADNDEWLHFKETAYDDETGKYTFTLDEEDTSNPYCDGGTGGSSVVVNASDEATGTLTKLTVDGVTYGVPVVEIEDLTSL